MIIYYKKIGNIDIELKKKSNDVGINIPLDRNVHIRAFETIHFSLHIGLTIPENYYGLVIAGPAITQQGVIVPPIIIPPHCNNEIKCVLTNCSAEQYWLKEGDLFCTILIISNPNIELTELNNLVETEHNNNGYGSTSELRYI